MAFAPIWEDEHRRLIPLEEMPGIECQCRVDVYLICGDQLLGLDMVNMKITRRSRPAVALPDFPLLPCVLPAWLEFGQIGVIREEEYLELFHYDPPVPLLDTEQEVRSR